MNIKEFSMAEQVSELQVPPLKEAHLFPGISLNPNATAENLTASLSALNLDRPDSLRSFFSQIAPISLPELRQLKRETADNPLKRMYQLMEIRAGKLRKNEEVGSLWRQVKPLFEGDLPEGVTQEDVNLFLRSTVYAMPEVGTGKQQEDVDTAVVSALFRLEPEEAPVSAEKPAQKQKKKEIHIYQPVALRRARQIAWTSAVVVPIVVACAPGLVPAVVMEGGAGISTPTAKAEDILPTELSPLPDITEEPKQIEPIVIHTGTSTAMEKPTAAATETKEPTPTAKETEAPKNPMEEYFIPQDQEEEKILAKGGIIISDNLTPSERSQLKVDQPGKYYIRCDATPLKKVLETNPNNMFVGLKVPRTDRENCEYGFSSAENMEARLRVVYPDASDDTIKDLLDKKIRLSHAMVQLMPDVFCFDIFQGISFAHANDRDHPEVSWAETRPGPNSKAGDYGKIMKLITIPIPQ